MTPIYSKFKYMSTHTTKSESIDCVELLNCIILLDYNYGCMDVFITSMLQLENWG